MIKNLRINPQQKEEYYKKGYWTDKTLLDLWQEQTGNIPDREYISDDYGLRLSYGEVDDKASRLASWLVEQGVERGDVVSFQLPSWAEIAIIFVACLKVGAVMHPLSRSFNDRDLIYNMNKVGTKVFICPTGTHATDYEEHILNVAIRTSYLSAIALVDKELPPKTNLPVLSEIINSYQPLTSSPVVNSDEVACMLTTSGTTGKPKSALLTHNNIIFSERSFTTALRRTADDVMLMSSPLNHATGFLHGLIAPFLLGGRTVLQQNFKGNTAIQLINRESVTWSMGATPFIYDILTTLENEEEQLSPAPFLYLCGGAPVPGSMVKRARKEGILLCEVYGSTESCPHVYVPPECCLEWDGKWSGIPFEGIEVRVVDRNRKEVARGQRGEECSRGPHQFVGYANDAERTDKVLDEEGWFYSGDICHMDEEGRIRICGRVKEIIIRGGENICTNEVDENLIGCKGIGEHATIGMPDERLGERICTFIVPQGDARPTLDDIRAFLIQKHVPKRLWPERIEFIAEIPKTATGKIKRYLLSEELAIRMKLDTYRAKETASCV